MPRILATLGTVLLSALVLSACFGGPSPREAQPATAAALIDPLLLQANARAEGEDYRIGPTDLLNITVFQVPELTFTGQNAVRVDASGGVQMPLIGTVRAVGLTPAELSADLARRLGERYLRNPHVTVTVAEAASQKVTVDGAVTKPGVYLMRGRTTLLQAVAMAEGPTQVADTRSVAVFRTGAEGRMVAVFDLAAIRAGQAEDPVLQGDDVVVVDVSRLNMVTRELLTALPAVGAFVYYIGR